MSLRSEDRRAFLFLGVFAAVLFASAQPTVAQLRLDVHIYVKMDFWEPIGSQTAEAWHFDPNNNGAWTQLSNWPVQGVEQPRAQFEVQDLFPSEHVGPWVWFLGVHSIAVKKGDPSNFADVSNQPAYSQMINRLVMGLDGEASSLVPIDPCGDRIWPHRRRQFTHGLRSVESAGAFSGHAHGEGGIARRGRVAVGESDRN